MDDRLSPSSRNRPASADVFVVQARRCPGADCGFAWISAEKQSVNGASFRKNANLLPIVPNMYSLTNMSMLIQQANVDTPFPDALCFQPDFMDSTASVGPWQYPEIT